MQTGFLCQSSDYQRIILAVSPWGWVSQSLDVVVWLVFSHRRFEAGMWWHTVSTTHFSTASHHTCYTLLYCLPMCYTFPLSLCQTLPCLCYLSLSNSPPISTVFLCQTAPISTVRVPSTNPVSNSPISVASLSNSLPVFAVCHALPYI